MIDRLTGIGAETKARRGWRISCIAARIALIRAAATMAAEPAARSGRAREDRGDRVDRDRRDTATEKRIRDRIENTVNRLSIWVGGAAVIEKLGGSRKNLRVGNPRPSVEHIFAGDEVTNAFRRDNTKEGHGLTDEEVESLRQRCTAMLSAAEAAGGTEKWEDARNALLATVFEVYPHLDKAEIWAYMDLRGLEDEEEVDPVRIRELAMALFLMGRPQALTFDSVVRVAFSIFDRDCDGEMNEDEFRQLMKATFRTHLTLGFVLRVPAGKKAFLRHLKAEHAEENFHFWRSSEQFASSIPTLPKAQTLFDGYIREGAPKQVNISAATNEAIRNAWHAIQNGEEPLTRKLFSAAQAEVFDLMQRDNFQRFLQNKSSMEDLENCLFEEVDSSNNGRISLEEYAEWATKNREAMGFMRAAGGRIAVVRTLAREGRPGWEVSNLVYPRGSKRISPAMLRVNMQVSKRIFLVRDDSSSSDPVTSSSCSSTASPGGGSGRRDDGGDGKIGSHGAGRHSVGGGGAGRARIESHLSAGLDDATRKSYQFGFLGVRDSHAVGLDSGASPSSLAPATVLGDEDREGCSANGKRQGSRRVARSGGHGAERDLASERSVREGCEGGEDRSGDTGGGGVTARVNTTSVESPVNEDIAARTVVVDTGRREPAPAFRLLSALIQWGSRRANKSPFRDVHRELKASGSDGTEGRDRADSTVASRSRISRLGGGLLSVFRRHRYRTIIVEGMRNTKLEPGR